MRREAELAALAKGVVPERYARNMGTLGPQGQRRLLESAVLVAGLGGLGGYVVESLARLGVGRIAGVDGGVFDEPDLNRQLLSEQDGLGQGKAQAARARILRVNPAVEFTAHPVPFQSLGGDVFRGLALAFDCLDAIPSRLELAARCSSAGLPLVHGAIAGWCAQVAVCPPGAGTLERIYAGAKGPRGEEAEAGNLPMTAAVAANLMVALAVPILLGRSAEPVLRVFDLNAPGAF
jgi:molybdopterin-synthase adenylyltransferase